MSVTTSDRTCSQVGCPFPERCLEGFDALSDCPFTGLTKTEAVATLDSVSDDDPDCVELEHEPANAVDEQQPDDQQDKGHREADAEELVDLLGAESLTLDDARPIMARQRCQVVLVAGDAKAGKTTLVVELYARFLTGPFHQWAFAGSLTLRALDLRHYPAQAASGMPRPDTVRTAEEDMRLLHLNLARGNEHRHLLFSDVRGEFFDNVVDGAPVSDNVEVAPRADRCIVTIDGARVADPRTAESAFMRAQLLIGGLLAEGGLEANVPIAVVCTKWDQVPQKGRNVVLERAEKLAQFAGRDGRPAHVQPLSVRPGPPVTELVGLPELLDWMVAPVPRPTAALTLAVPAGRQFWGPGGPP